MKNKKPNPLQDNMYGGIPTGGGYDSFTEYEIGAQSIAEAIHCILGSLEKEGAQKVGFGWEAEHIEEELGIINKSILEYSKSLYRADNWNNNPYKNDSIKSIQSASRALVQLADDMRSQMEVAKERLVVKQTALLCYDVLIFLATEMLKSVDDRNGSMNAFQSEGLRNVVANLTTVINKELAQKVESVIDFLLGEII